MHFLLGTLQTPENCERIFHTLSDIFHINANKFDKKEL